MKDKRFDEILTKYYPDYPSVKGYLAPPVLLSMAVGYFFENNIQGPDMDELRKFCSNFRNGKEYFED